MPAELDIYMLDRDAAATLGDLGRLLRPAEIRELDRRVLLIASSLDSVEPILPALSTKADARLLLLCRAAEEDIDVLSRRFRCVLWRNDRFATLAPKEIGSVLAEDFPGDYAIAVEQSRRFDSILVVRGSLQVLSLTGEQLIGKPIGSGEIRIEDGGQTLVIGKTEIPIASILYERDRDFRRRYRTNLTKKDDSFGGALKRLRLLRGLSRNELGVSAKEIARIERGEVEKPHAETLQAIARRLRVDPSQIETY